MKMTTRSFVSGIALGGATLAMAFGSVDRAQAATLLNDNFNTENGAVGTLGYTGFANWTVSTGVDLLGNGTYDIYPGNGLFVDLNGESAGAITSTNSFTFASNETATLSFNYGSNNLGTDGTNTSARIFLGGVEIAQLTNPGGSSFATFSQTFSNPTSGTLRFEAINPGTGGIVIDNISLVSTSVPEPSDFVGTAFAFGSVVLLKRKMTKKKLG
ncbi:PEP-CTERM sorting domain-containing protein [Chamaesiphon sp. OTE_75_metabat_556]|uniref:PEP-CTERM sorting domain-containing protein n=1 Tax=Chamaesiphon sp. OTE_75_metabat_556 TaxID=2964692 RepID=UPI00286B9913|nr:PEP-CTERM sorting domain-containing protein [Chamaesiphon sp. OTE_75_metabat_556]